MAAAEKAARATVARGRTVTVDGNDFGPGAEITLPVAEIDQLRRSGHLVTPGVVELPRGDGPVFSPEDGPKVTVS